MCKFTTEDGNEIHGRTNQFIGHLFSDDELNQLLFKITDVVQHPCRTTHSDERYRYVKFDIESTSSGINASTEDRPPDRLQMMRDYYFGFHIDAEDRDDFIGKLVRLERGRSSNESTLFTLYEAALPMSKQPVLVKVS